VTPGQRFAAGVIKWAGRRATATLRRKHSLKAGSSYTNSLTAGAASAGATTLVLSGSSALSGTITKGCVLTLGAALLTVQEDATASGGTVTVTVSPALSSPVMAGSALTISRPYGEETYFAAKRGEEQVDLPNRAAVTVAAIRLANEGQPTPQEGQELVFGGVARQIVKRANLGAGEVPDCWVVWLEREAA
jgi:hypothetical protein